ncbi:hypothetical protein BC835DRAFT_1306848 [Cytidiella melzeri]|nr:hypothetical protein BC835DRAFT_1306848 [Cytidiella melzeri]
MYGPDGTASRVRRCLKQDVYGERYREDSLLRGEVRKGQVLKMVNRSGIKLSDSRARHDGVESQKGRIQTARRQEPGRIPCNSSVGNASDCHREDSLVRAEDCKGQVLKRCIVQASTSKTQELDGIASRARSTACQLRKSTPTAPSQVAPTCPAIKIPSFLFPTSPQSTYSSITATTGGKAGPCLSSFSEARSLYVGANTCVSRPQILSNPYCSKVNTEARYTGTQMRFLVESAWRLGAFVIGGRIEGF